VSHLVGESCDPVDEDRVPPAVCHVPRPKTRSHLQVKTLTTARRDANSRRGRRRPRMIEQWRCCRGFPSPPPRCAARSQSVPLVPRGSGMAARDHNALRVADRDRLFVQLSGASGDGARHHTCTRHPADLSSAGMPLPRAYKATVGYQSAPHEETTGVHRPPLTDADAR
jgi:hypothetical protein